MPPDKGVDLEIGSTLVQVKAGTDAIRNLRSELLDLGLRLHRRPGAKGLVVLVNPKLTHHRLETEWNRVRQVLRPNVSERLQVAIFAEGELRGLHGPIDPQLRERVTEYVQGHASQRSGTRLPRPDHHAEILKILIHQWMLAKGPMTADWLAKTAGCTYPTVAKSLEVLEPFLRRHSHRRFELHRFPKSEWASLVATMDKHRQTLSYADRSGQARSAEQLMKRIASLARSDLALGGIVGARAHYEKLDVFGTPRVDLTVHCPTGRIDLEFVSRLDPGLMPITERNEPPAVVIHVLRRQEAFFLHQADRRIADPVECLLDLHAARFEAQAEEFLRYYSGRAAIASP